MIDVPPEVLIAIAIVALFGCVACIALIVRDRSGW